jgi:cyclopropane fatty-acyl-phospholipid synthase-like methyltransferase
MHTSTLTLIGNILLAIATVLTTGTVNAQTHHTHQHHFQDAAHWSKIFDDPERDAWQKPHEVIQALKLKPDSVVADIGAGTGYFSMRFAHMTPKGKVYAVDAEPDMVKHLSERAKKNGLSNVIAIQARPDDPRLPEKADLVILVDVYHHIDKRVDYFRKLRDSLKPSGRLAIIDFTMETHRGPPPSGRVAASKVKRELTEAGYVPAEEHRFLPDQFFSIFTVNGTK